MHPGIQPESPDEMALVPKPAIEEDFGQGNIGVQEFFSFFYTPVLQAGMDALSMRPVACLQ